MILDANPKYTRITAGLAEIIKLLSAQVRARDIEASSPLFIAAAEVLHAADKLYESIGVELELLIREQDHAPAAVGVGRGSPYDQAQIATYEQKAAP